MTAPAEPPPEPKTLDYEPPRGIHLLPGWVRSRLPLHLARWLAAISIVNTAIVLASFVWPISVQDRPQKLAHFASIATAACAFLWVRRGIARRRGIDE